MDGSVKAAKEAFVSNLTGTTWLEVDEIIVAPPLCVLVYFILGSTLVGHRNGILLKLL